MREGCGAGDSFCAGIREGRTGRKTVLMCDKWNVMTFAGGLWQRVRKEVAQEYPKNQAQHMYVDALCLQMVRESESLEVIVTNNMFGDIITDLAAALQGGLGDGGQREYTSGTDVDVRAGTWIGPADRGKNMANPMGAF